jgi:Uncharacterized conserved protein (DUF2203)
MVELAAGLGELAGDRRAAANGAAGNGGAVRSEVPRSPELAAAAAGLQACLHELAELGVEVKDVSTGLLDFPAVRHGEEVLLCWRVGEESVAWWHDRASGFAGRREIDWEGGDEAG